MGGLVLVLWGARIYLFDLTESPKFLMGRGRFAKAVVVMHRVAAYNQKTIELTEEDLRRAGDGVPMSRDNHWPSVTHDTGLKGALLRRLEEFNISHLKALFATPQLARSSVLIISLWALIGLAFPLYNAFISYATNLKLIFNY